MEEAEQEMEEAKQQMEEVGQELEDEAAEMWVQRNYCFTRTITMTIFLPGAKSEDWTWFWCR